MTLIFILDDTFGSFVKVIELAVIQGPPEYGADCKHQDHAQGLKQI
jgi:hypothetical protein